MLGLGEGEGGLLSGMMVLFWKQMHLQYEVGCFRALVWGRRTRRVRRKVRRSAGGERIVGCVEDGLGLKKGGNRACCWCCGLVVRGALRCDCG